MKSQLKLMIGLVLAMAFVTAGCQQKSNKRESRIGRLARGQAGPMINGMPSPLQPGSPNTQWGEIISNNQAAFDQELSLFTSPMLGSLSQDEQLGRVSAQSGQRTGVVFWGEAPMRGMGMSGYTGGMNNGTLDGSRARLHIEIYDDKTGAARADGSIRSQIIVHIGYDQDGFVGAQGSVQGNQVNLMFRDETGTVTMRGSLNSQYFAGQIYYSTAETFGQERQLGNFQVPACGFFVCN